jgi:AcrR family transcriptional regulator
VVEENRVKGVAPASRDEKRAINRERVLDAATELFFERGYAGTTIGALCEALGVTKPFIYWYFKDKAHILDTLCEESAMATQGALTLGAKAGGSPVERLRAGLHALLLSHVERFKAGSLYYRDTAFLSEETRRKIRIRSRRFHRTLTAMIQAGVDDGALPTQNARLTALAIGGIAGFMYTWYRPDGALTQTELAAQLCESMMRTAGWPPG